MQIVIDIPENIIKHISDGSFEVRPDDKHALVTAVMDGIPLPKKHGKLIDGDELLKHAHDITVPVYPTGYEYKHYCVAVDSIYESRVLINAYKEKKKRGCSKCK